MIAKLIYQTIILITFVSAGMTQTYSSMDFPHPSFGIQEISSEQLTKLFKSTEREQKMSEKQLVDLIEQASMANWIHCPNCEGGIQGGLLSWTPENHHKAYCRYCRMTFPNSKYPDDKVQEIYDKTGRLQKLRYYEDPHSKQRYYFRAKIRDEQFIHLLGVVYNFASIYSATGDTRYARKSVVLLNRMAEVYPHLLPHAGLPLDQGPGRFTDLKLPHEYYSGKIRDWWYAEIPWQCAEAYDIVYHSGELEKMSAELGADIKKRIENDLLRQSVEYVLEFNSLLSNAEINTMASMVAVGRAIGEPRYVHEAVRRGKELLEWHFFRDGMWMECSGYHFDVVDHFLRLMRALQGYSDPVDYVDPIYGTHFVNFDPEKEFPTIPKAKAAYFSMFLPDGFWPSIGDTRNEDRTWYTPRKRELRGTDAVLNGPSLVRIVPPSEAAKAGILPGAGYAWLGMGKGEDQIQSSLIFYQSAGHTHADGLHLSIFAHGHQLLPDLGYTHTRMRWWTWGTLAHNTVIVDGVMQNWGNESLETGGDLLLYDADDPGIQLIEAGNENRYNTDKIHRVDLFRRLLLLWDFGGEHPVLVDIFRVQGGERHEWLAHGPVYQPFAASISVPMAAQRGTLLGEDKTYEQAVAFLGLDGKYDAAAAEKLAGNQNPRYGFIHDLQKGSSDRYWKLTFSPAPGKKGPCLDLHMAGGQDRQLILGKAPAVVPAMENDAIAADPQMPMLLVRRERQGQLKSLFPVVWEAHVKEGMIEELEPLKFEGGNEMDVAFRIRLKNQSKSLVVVSLYNPSHVGIDHRKIYLDSHAFEFAGALMAAEVDQGQFVKLDVWNCASLTIPSEEFSFQTDGIVCGEVSRIIRSSRKMMITSLRELPDSVAQGRWILVRLPDGKQEGFSVQRWERSPGNPHAATITLTDDPGLDGNPRAGTLHRAAYRQKVFDAVTYVGIPWELPTHVTIERTPAGAWVVREK